MLVHFLEIKFEMIVGLKVWYYGEQLFHFFLCFQAYLITSQYDNTLLSFILFSYPK